MIEMTTSSSMSVNADRPRAAETGGRAGTMMFLSSEEEVPPEVPERRARERLRLHPANAGDAA